MREVLGGMRREARGNGGGDDKKHPSDDTGGGGGGDGDERPFKDDLDGEILVDKTPSPRAFHGFSPFAVVNSFSPAYGCCGTPVTAKVEA